MNVDGVSAGWVTQNLGIEIWIAPQWFSPALTNVLVKPTWQTLLIQHCARIPFYQGCCLSNVPCLSIRTMTHWGHFVAHGISDPLCHVAGKIAKWGSTSVCVCGVHMWNIYICAYVETIPKICNSHFMAVRRTLYSLNLAKWFNVSSLKTSSKWFASWVLPLHNLGMLLITRVSTLNQSSVSSMCRTAYSFIDQDKSWKLLAMISKIWKACSPDLRISCVFIFWHLKKSMRLWGLSACAFYLDISWTQKTWQIHQPWWS